MSGSRLENQEFSFVCVKFEVPIKCVSGNVTEVGGNTSLELRMETWAQTIYVGINSL